MDFNELEIAVLKEISRQPADIAPTLAEQFKAATVTSRANTGAGFFTDIDVATERAPKIDCKGPLGSVWMHVDGLSNPMIFLLFLEDGYMRTLESASVDDSTANFDFNNAKFRMYSA